MLIIRFFSDIYRWKKYCTIILYNMTVCNKESNKVFASFLILHFVCCHIFCNSIFLQKEYIFFMWQIVGYKINLKQLTLASKTPSLCTYIPTPGANLNSTPGLIIKLASFSIITSFRTSYIESVEFRTVLSLI